LAKMEVKNKFKSGERERVLYNINYELFNNVICFCTSRYLWLIITYSDFSKMFFFLIFFCLYSKMYTGGGIRDRGGVLNPTTTKIFKKG
jgi:hypothetical protein